jgi:hypothetical protein
LGDEGRSGVAAAEAPLPESLSPAQRAFEEGDFANAARLARAVVDGGDEATRAAAREMIARFRVDPLVIALMAGALFFFIVCIAVYR